MNVNTNINSLIANYPSAQVSIPKGREVIRSLISFKPETD